MERAAPLTRLITVMAAVGRQRALEEAAGAGWPLPDSVAVHLWLYSNGWFSPTPPEHDE